VKGRNITMTLQELLKAQNLTDEQVKGILDAMKQNKIYTASEENLDVRYGKLKTDMMQWLQRMQNHRS
jgi:CRISPR/Cas system CSM-associated protein Csm2 small subunit